MVKTRSEVIRHFAESVLKNIKDYLPAEYRDYQYQITEVEKNNGIRRIGITFKKPEHQVSPLIYMDKYYDNLCGGMNFNSVMNQIADTVKENSQIQKEFHQRVVPSLLDYDGIKPHIVVRLINAKANRDILKEIPHRRIEDLAIICVAEYNSWELQLTASSKVNDSLLSEWGIEASELFETALENTKNRYQARLSSMEDTMVEMFGFDEYDNNILNRSEPIMPEDCSSMYILTNTDKEYGAAVILYPGLMDRITGIFPDGFYIIPSSTHEMLIVPDSEGISPKILGEMVRNVNKQLTNHEDYLSDRVYRYDKERGQICQVPESMERGKEMVR